MFHFHFDQRYAVPIVLYIVGMIGCSITRMIQRARPVQRRDDDILGNGSRVNNKANGEPETRGTLILVSLVAALVFVFDLLMPLGVAAAVPYIFVVLLSLRSDRESVVIVAASVSTALTALGFFLSPDGGVLWMNVFNRALAAIAVWVTALLCMAQKKEHSEQMYLMTKTEAASREKKLIEESLQKLKASEAKTRAILESAADGIITIDEKGLIQSINRTALKIFGHQDADLVGQNVSVLMPTPYCNEHDSYIERYLQTGVGSVIGTSREVRGQRKDGTIFPMNLSVSELSIDSERLFTGIARDITDQKRAEEELRQSRRHLEAANERLSETAREQEAFNALTVGRELRMIELKVEINSLNGQLGLPPKYQIVDDEVNV